MKSKLAVLVIALFASAVVVALGRPQMNMLHDTAMATLKAPPFEMFPFEIDVTWYGDSGH